MHACLKAGECTGYINKAAAPCLPLPGCAKAARILAGWEKRNRERAHFVFLFLAKSSPGVSPGKRGEALKSTTVRTVSTSWSRPSWFSTPCGTYMHVSSPVVCVKERSGGGDVGGFSATRVIKHTRHASASARAVPPSLSLSLRCTTRGLGNAPTLARP